MRKERNQNILVVGGAGYIGSHTCLAIHEMGFNPITYDNLARGNEQQVLWGPLEIGDIRDEINLREVIHKYQPEAVIHLGALAYVGESVSHPIDYYDNNVNGTLKLLKVMHEEGIKNIVFSSTCAVYGNPDSLPVTEKHSILPVSPYGRTKWMVEQAIKDHSDAYGLAFFILRYFNAAGADPKGRIGEIHDPEPHLIPRAIKVALRKIESLDIYGDDYPTSDGTCIRDYVHVSDIAQAHLLSLRKLSEGSHSNQIINLGGGGTGYSVREVVQRVEAHLGSVKGEIAPRREGDAEVLLADISKARRVLGWIPEKSSLDNIIETAVEWEKKLG
jgi:UDP-arabinose 4-epimerase